MSSWSWWVKIRGLNSSIEVQLPTVSGNLKKIIYSCLCTSFVSCYGVLTEKIDETGNVVTINNFSRLRVGSLLVSYGDSNVWPGGLCFTRNKSDTISPPPPPPPHTHTYTSVLIRLPSPSTLCPRLPPPPPPPFPPSSQPPHPFLPSVLQTSIGPVLLAPSACYIPLALIYPPTPLNLTQTTPPTLAPYPTLTIITILAYHPPSPWWSIAVLVFLAIPFHSAFHSVPVFSTPPLSMSLSTLCPTIRPISLSPGKIAWAHQHECGFFSSTKSKELTDQKERLCFDHAPAFYMNNNIEKMLMNNKFKAQTLNRKSYKKFTLPCFKVTCFKHVM